MRKSSSISILKDPNLNGKEGWTKWAWPGHASVIEVVYGALPDKVKKNLDLEKMKDGSNDPDQKFKDTSTHHYPSSYKRAVKWLDEGKTSYAEKDYERASYCFGVASHYISDTFSAPHCVSHEKDKDHHNFEITADDLMPQISPVKGDLDTLMKDGVIQGQLDWKRWMKNKKDSSAVQDEINQAASVTLLAIKSSLK
jgi:hypothetical protein